VMTTRASSGSPREWSTTATLMSPEPTSSPIVDFLRPKSAITSKVECEGTRLPESGRTRREHRRHVLFSQTPDATSRPRMHRCVRRPKSMQQRHLVVAAHYTTARTGE
jgi:hypothetical protein